MWYQNIRSALFSFVTIHASDGRTDGQTDRQTDRQNCDSNTVHCITCSRTVKTRGQRHHEYLEMSLPVVDFLVPIRHNWIYSLLLTVETMYAEICRSQRLSKGEWVTLSANFRRRGRRPPTTVGVRKLEWLSLPFHVDCGIKISAVHCLVLSQSMRVMDRQTDGQIDGRAELRQLIPR